jgi:hypothetical protein
VKLQVAEADAARAGEILEAPQHALADLGKEEFAAEAVGASDADSIEDPAMESVAEAAGASDDEIENPIEELAGRAQRAAVFGLVFCPLSLYAARLIGRLLFSTSELSDVASRRMWTAFGLTLFIFLAYGALLHVLGP